LRPESLNREEVGQAWIDPASAPPTFEIAVYCAVTTAGHHLGGRRDLFIPARFRVWDSIFRRPPQLRRIGFEREDVLPIRSSERRQHVSSRFGLIRVAAMADESTPRTKFRPHRGKDRQARRKQRRDRKNLATPDWALSCFLVFDGTTLVVNQNMRRTLPGLQRAEICIYATSGMRQETPRHTKLRFGVWTVPRQGFTGGSASALRPAPPRCFLEGAAPPHNSYRRRERDRSGDSLDLPI